MSGAAARGRRLHVGLYRLLLRLTPSEHRARHGRRQVELFADLLAGGQSPWRLWWHAVPDLAAVVSERAGGRPVPTLLARVALVPLSLAALAAGLVLAGSAVAGDAVPAWVAAPAAAVAVQGGWTLAWTIGHSPVPAPAAARITTVGETAALVLGVVGLVSSVSLQHGSADPEYGPLTILTLVVVHAAAGLTAASAARPQRA